jgi:hypothetical protein
MSRDGFRPVKKMSQHQLTEIVHGLSHRIDLLHQGAAADLRRLNVLFFSLLKDMGKAEEVVCYGCEMTNIRPLLPDIEIDPRCADCGLLLDGISEEAFTDADLMDDSEE